MPGAVSHSDGALSGDKACGGMDTCSARSTGDISDCRGSLAAYSIAGWLGNDGDGDEGGKWQPLICGICLFLANTAALLLARVASL